MQIIQTPPPKLDSPDAKVNFTKIQQYLQNTIETIDFILAKYAGALEIVDTDGVDKKIKEVQAQIVSLDRSVTDLKNAQNTAEGDISDLESAVASISNSITSINGSINSINSTLSDHESRISALENPGGGA